MNIYLVRDKDKGGYLHIQYNHLVTWVPKEKCTVYTEHKLARHAGMYAFNNDEGAEEKFEIVHLVARAVVDDIYAPRMLDGELIRLAGRYFYFTEAGVADMYVAEISTELSDGGMVVSLREDRNKLDWLHPDDLYSTEPLAWVAWKEAQ